MNHTVRHDDCPECGARQRHHTGTYCHECGTALLYESFAASAEAGYPFACEWFAGCTSPAAEAVEHPILTAVPTCAEHAKLVADCR